MRDIMGMMGKVKEMQAKMEKMQEEIAARDVPAWLELDRKAITGRVISEPGPGDWESYYNPNAVIEYYSR